MRVLVPVDFSETSRRALAWAFDYALRAPCELHIVHIVEAHATDVMPHIADARENSDLSAIDEAARSEMARIVPPADRPLLGKIMRHVGYGTPHKAILNLARDLQVDLIIMGTHGRTGLAHLLFGSVAEQVVRRAPCPVVCVKPIDIVTPLVENLPIAVGERS